MADNMELSLEPEPTAAGRARRAVAGIGLVDSTQEPTLLLLVSELVSNSVKYGGDGAVTLQVDAPSAGRVRVEVVDQGVGFVPVARNRPVTEVGGWGLHLVQTLANRWGVYEGSTHVWFEVRAD